MSTGKRTFRSRTFQARTFKSATWNGVTTGVVAIDGVGFECRAENNKLQARVPNQKLQTKSEGNS